MNNKGQTVFTEYVMIFFVVMATLVAMTTFVQRGLQARIHDARNFMINAVVNDQVCDANCMQATGNTIAYEYEPYYQQTAANVQQNDQEGSGATPGNAAAIGAVYYKTVNTGTTAQAISYQVPPGCADGVNPRPSYCNGFQPSTGSGQ